ncbi:MAG: efflux RND transporter periplasmic adaptor subunit [Cyclobacteriaceae bacterium]
MNKTVKRILTVVIVLVILFLAALPKLDLFKDQDEPGSSSAIAQPATSKIIPVNAIVLEPKRLSDKIQVTGAILANEALEIRSEISGKITGIHFQEGQWMKRGSLLLTINDEELRAQLEKLRFTRKLREDMEYRQRLLLEKEAISQEEYDQALTELNTSSADIKVLEAQIAKSQIHAPFDGVIGLRYVSEGSYITPQTAIASFSNIDPAKVEFSIPGKYSNDVKIEDIIEFRTEASSDIHEGKIYAIDPMIDPTTRTLKMRAISPNPERQLLPGQFARIDLILGRQDEALLVPTEAVIPELDGHKVFVAKQGVVEERKVQVGIRTNKEVEIAQGLSQKDTVVTSGILQIKSGSQVDVTLIDTPLTE